jgi:HEPN domain-containing protein/predicted nucleotidyltransferase
MNIEYEKEIENITAQIIEKYRPDKIILFGSAARGELSRDSDADFLIIKKETPLYGADRIRQLSRLIERNIPLDLLVYRPEEFEKRLKMGDPFLKAILKEGKILALINLEEGKTFFAQICFHFQQAAEKYLKAYIIDRELDFRKIHDLPMLLKLCLQKDASFRQLQEDCEFLTTYYVDTRYPVHWPTHFSQDETQKAFQSAKRIRSVVEQGMSRFI